MSVFDQSAFRLNSLSFFDSFCHALACRAEARDGRASLRYNDIWVVVGSLNRKMFRNVTSWVAGGLVGLVESGQNWVLWNF
jgi:hypothetical protein